LTLPQLVRVIRDIQQSELASTGERNLRLNLLGILLSGGLDTDTQSQTSGRLPLEYAAALILLFAAVFVVHFVRRAYRQPKRIGGTPMEVPGNTVKAFDIVERLFHWSLFITLGLVMVSGVAIYLPGTFNFLLSAFGVAGTNAAQTAADLAWHTDMLWLLLGLIAIHIVWDLAVARTGKTIIPRGHDIKDTMIRVQGFLGVGPSVQPRHGKYDAFMKLFHWGLVLCLVVLGISGLYLWSPYGIMPTISPSLESTLRLFHDFFAFLLIGLVAGHIYFAILPINWPVLRSILTGTISGDAYNHDFDSSRWTPKKQKAAAAPAAQASGPAPTMVASGAGNDVKAGPSGGVKDDSEEMEVR
jgi:cytochrome b subunit of formate dehydrogenase